MEIPKNAVQVHLYNVENILKPRGSMKKESLSAYIHDKLTSVYDSWTDEKYGDKVESVELLHLIRENLMSEVQAAFGKLINDIGEENPELARAYFATYMEHHDF